MVPRFAVASSRGCRGCKNVEERRAVEGRKEDKAEVVRREEASGLCHDAPRQLPTSL